MVSCGRPANQTPRPQRHPKTPTGSFALTASRTAHDSPQTSARNNSTQLDHFLLGAADTPFSEAVLGAVDATFSAPFCIFPPVTPFAAADPSTTVKLGRLAVELLALLLLLVLFSSSLPLLLLRELPPLPLLQGAGMAASGETSGRRLLRAMACRRPKSCFFTTSKACSNLSSSSAETQVFRHT